MIIKLLPQDFELVSGNDKDLLFTTLDENDNVVDLTGATIVWALSRAAKNKSRLVTYTSPTNLTITDAAAGLFTVKLQSADTEGLKADDYYHEVRLTSAAGRKTTLAIGTVKILDNVINT